MVKAKITLIAIVIIFTILTCIHPVYPHQQVLQHLGTLALLIPLLFDIKYNKLHLSSFMGISFFALLHVLGARYIYSYVPYDEWFRSFPGWDIQEYFGWKRNHYDRFVHFSFGVLMFPVLYQSTGIWKGMNNFARILIVWAFIQTFSMVYELFEWALTIVMSQETANDYNGQQGDMWDAQKDMAFAMLGSSLMAGFYLLKGISGKEQ